MSAEVWAAIVAGLPIVLPVVIKIGHSLGYEMPILSGLADWIARRGGS